MSNLEIAYNKIAQSGLTSEEQRKVKVEASKNPGIAEGIKLEDPITDDFLREFLREQATGTVTKSVGTKRGYDQALVENVKDIAPSSFGLTNDKHSWTNTYSKLHLKCHRPTAAECGVHVSLMSEILATFCENARTVVLDREDYSFAVDFCDTMCTVFATEDERMSAANELLSKYFGQTMSRLSGKGAGWRNDGGLLVVCGGNAANTAAALHTEIKREMCGSHSAPEQQNIAHYMKIVSESEFARDRSVCPALLITIAGPHMGICAAVHGQGPCVDPVVPLLPLLVLKQDKRMMAAVTRALKATKVCLWHLKGYYNNLSDSAPSPQDIEQLIFPYPRIFHFGGNAVPFVYDRQLGDKLLFEAHVSQAVSDLRVGQEIYVKYTDSYCCEAHEQCYALEQSAPRLYAHSVLANGWHMVVMEKLAGADFRPQEEPQSVKEKLQRVVQHLHTNGWVHGDLRANNIRVVGDRVCLVDFDWAGRAGEQRYPGFMNHTDVEWPAGASDGEFLQCEHDKAWLERLV